MEARGLQEGCGGRGGPPRPAGPQRCRLSVPTEGYYLHMDANTFPQGGVVRLRSPDIWEQGPLCVHFAFHMFGLSWGAQLRLLLFQGRAHRPSLLWKHVNTQSASWVPTTVTVPADRDIPSWVSCRPAGWGRVGAAGGSVGCFCVGLGT